MSCLSALQVCLAWDDDHLQDPHSPLLAAMKSLNPIRSSSSYGACILSCLLADPLLLPAQCVSSCKLKLVSLSSNFCNLTDASGTVRISSISFPFPAGLLPWFLFLRNPLDDPSYPQHAPELLRYRCLQTREGNSLPRSCTSDKFWTLVEEDTRVRFVNQTFLSSTDEPPTIRFPPPVPLLVRAGARADLDTFTYSRSSGAGVEGRTMVARFVAVPSQLPGSRRPSLDDGGGAGGGGGAAASVSLDLGLLVSSKSNFVCIGGLGCNPSRSLTDA
eukprot:277672-Hanusia_phi.AAC.1